MESFYLSKARLKRGGAFLFLLSIHQEMKGDL